MKHRRIITKMRVAVAQARFAVCVLFFAFAAVFAAEARAQTAADVDECALGTDTCGADHLCGNTDGGFVCGQRCPNGFVHGSNRTECAETCDSASRMLDADNDCVLLANIREDVATRICVDAGWHVQYVILYPPGEVLGTVLGRECSIPYRDATAQTDESGCYLSAENLATARSHDLTTASQYCWELFIQNGAPLASAHGADDRYVHTCPDGKEPGADLKSCVCPAGYVTDRDGSCVDINECAADANTCGANDACVNTVGGHACECGAGHSKISETLASQCADINECAAGTDSCDANALCENTVGGFTCTPCPAGFQPNGDRGECVSAPAACPPGEMRNESGSCVCDATRRMSANGQCAPTQSGAFQICRDKGWTVAELTFQSQAQGVTGALVLVGAECRIPYRNVAAQTDEAGCLLRDDNQSDFHKQQAGLTATTPCAELFLEDELIPLAADHAAGDRYVHSCPQGFIVSNDLKECVCPQGRIDIDGICADINECTDNTHVCGENSVCVNWPPGSYRCNCASGYDLESPDGFQCADVDECAAGTDACDANAPCVNTVGGFVCGNQCPAGFVPNADRDECVEANPCPAGETRDENGDCVCDPATRFINAGYGNACHITSSAATQMCRDSGWNVVTVFHNSVTLGAVCAIPYRDETAQTDETGCSLWQNYRHPDFAQWDSHQTTSQRCRNLFDARPAPTTLNHGDGDRYVHSCTGGKTPTADSKRCVCPEGWTEDDSGMCSADINECTTNTHTCGANAQCVNTEGGHACECDAGYETNGDWTLQNPQCADINECAAETDSCGENSLCDNTLGGFVCGNECPDGFIPNADRSECVDASVCPPLHILDSVNGECVCDSAQAAYAGEICVPRTAATTCETAGWQTETHEHLGNILKVECLIPLRNAATKVNEGGCFLLPPADNSIADYQTDATKSCYEIFGDDIPMTLTHAPNDRYVHTCPGMKVQSADYRTCECPSGYEENADGFCVDINECAIGAHSCGENAQCVNTEGAHACACAAGYASVGDWTFLDPQCGDVNECALGTDDCGVNTLCGNLAGGYVCESACPDGMHVNLLRTKCEPCPPGEMQDENGECVCDPETRFRNTGYGGACHLTSDGATTTCLEAGWLVATVTHNNNVLGAVCKIPYRDETAKADETGCSLWHYLSHPDLDHWGEYETTSQRCRDLFDAYTIPLTLNHVADDRYVHTCPPPKTPSDDLKSCDCPVGYEKDAEGNCADINECETDSHTCGANAQCTNTPGGHICSCSPGYQSTDASLQNLQCEDIDECSTGAHSCGGQDSAQCVNTDGDYQCACYVNHAALNPNDPKNPQCRGTYDLTLPQSANGTLYAKYGGATVTSAVNYVPQGVTISLIAAPAPGFYILEWSGDCDHLHPGKPSQHGRPITCGLTMNAHKSAGATFARAWTTQFNSRPPEGGALSAKVKNGVTLQTGGAAQDGATVVYSAKPLPQFYLLEWGGECESEPGGGPSDRGAERTCERVLNSDHQVSVVFHRAVSVSFTSNPPNGTLSARVKNEGTTLQTGDIVAQGTTIVYAAQSDDGYYLQEWTGECANLPSALPEKYGLTATCEIADATGPIGALFAPAQRVTFDSQPPNGNISARIQGGITLHSGDFAPRGVTVVYKAKPYAAFYLRQWTGECEGESGAAPSEFGLSQECARALNTDHQVGAVFHRAQQVVFFTTASGGTLSARFKNGEAALPGVVVAQGTTVIYSAHPDDGYYLLEWTGGCAAQRPAEPSQHGLVQTCELDDASLPVSALFARGWKTTFDSTPPNGTLSARVQNGITLQSGHIAPQGATVIYTARPDPEFYLREWTGDCAGRPVVAPSDIGQTQTCRVTLTADSQAGAVFHRASPVIYVPDPPNGTLSAQTKDGAPLPPDHLAPEGTTVIYTARPDDGYYLLKWLGGCARRESAEPSARGQAQTCEVADAASAVEAVFERAWQTTLNQPDNGTLSAESADGETLQSGDIKREGITVIFTVQPDSGFYLLEWSGACVGQPAAEPSKRGLSQTCELTLTAETTVGATLERAWETTLNQPDNGTLSAESADGETLQSGDIEREGITVIYTAQPDSGFYLLEWGGTCVGQPAAEPSERGLPKTCELTLTAETTVGATFERAWETTFNQPDNGTLSAENADGETLQSGDIKRGGTTVIFTAQPDSGFYLLEWSGACAGQPTAEPSERGLPKTCELTLTAETTVGATFERAWETTLNQPDNGALYAESADGETLQSGDIKRGGTTVIFTAQPDSGFYLLEWSGACVGQPAAEPSERGLSQTCELTLTAETTVGATFERAWETTLNQPNNGALSAERTDGETLQSGDIEREGTTVIYTAQPDSGFYLLEWSGACAGQPAAEPSERGLPQTCELTLTVETTVGATFERAWKTTFNQPDNGALSAESADGETLQSGDIEREGITVTFTAQPDSGFYLLEWSGACVGQPAAEPSERGLSQTCELTLTAETTVGATFERAWETTFNQPDNGALSAENADGETLQSGAIEREGITVIYTAQPDSGFYLLEWGGACAGQPAAEPSERGLPKTCELTLTAETTVGATLERAWQTTLNQPDNGTLSAENADGEPLQSGDIEREGITVTFTAQPDSGFYLLEWSGTCVGQPAAEPSERGLSQTCELTLTVETTVGATLERAWQTTLNQPDNGTLSAENADGETLQSGDIEREGTTVIYTAQPDSGFYLLEWSGACAGQPAAEPSERGLPQTCELTLTAETTVGATFERAWQTTLNQPDNGALSAENADGETLQSGDIKRGGTTVIFTAQPDSGFYLLEWSGTCAGHPAAEPSERGLPQTCELTLTAETTVGATFERAWETTLNQPDNGALSAENAGGETLQSGDIEREGITVIYTAQPDSGFYLLEWSGTCAGQPAAEPSERGLPKTCELTLTAETTVGATFERAWEITFDPQPPNGTLSARGKDGNALRPGDFVADGATIVFTATPNPGFYMREWGAQACDASFDNPERNSGPQTCEAVVDDSFGANPPAPIFSSSSCFFIQNARADGGNPDKCVCADPNHLMFGEGANWFCAPPTICPAGYSEEDGDCIAPNASALPDYANSPEGCSKTFGGALRMVDGQPICSEIDIQGTFCFVGAREIFPCRGLFKHVWKCNRLNRPALNPFTCDPVCSEDGNIARGRHCGKQTANGVPVGG